MDVCETHTRKFPVNTLYLPNAEMIRLSSQSRTALCVEIKAHLFICASFTRRMTFRNIILRYVYIQYIQIPT